MATRTIVGVLMLVAVVAPTQAQHPDHYFGTFSAQEVSGDRRVSVICIHGGSCRIEMRMMRVRAQTQQCFLTTVVWDDISAMERGRRFHTPAQRQGTHASSTFSFAIRGRDVVSLREVYEVAEFQGREASSRTFRYEPTSQREGGSAFDVSGCDELSLN